MCETGGVTRPGGEEIDRRGVIEEFEGGRRRGREREGGEGREKERCREGGGRGREEGR